MSIDGEKSLVKEVRALLAIAEIAEGGGDSELAAISNFRHRIGNLKEPLELREKLGLGRKVEAVMNDLNPLLKKLLGEVYGVGPKGFPAISYTFDNYSLVDVQYNIFRRLNLAEIQQLTGNDTISDGDTISYVDINRITNLLREGIGQPEGLAVKIESFGRSSRGIRITFSAGEMR